MPTEWERLYAEAFDEPDTEKVPELCDCARRAINDRLLELTAAQITDEEERERLFEALRKLLLYEYERRPPK